MSADAPTIFLVAGEASGDQLGADLMRALRERQPAISFRGVGGPLMLAEGLDPLFAMAEINVMGLIPVLRRLPALIRRIRQTVDAVLDAPPLALVIIDAPDFTHRVAARVRRRNPSIPIVDYVSPTVWAWRPGRARRMRAYVDHLLAILPFEPEAHRRLGGPPCTYVGHPLLGRLAEIRPSPSEQAVRDGERPLLLVLPGSRRAEVEHLMPVFGDAVMRMAALFPTAEFVLPAVEHVRPAIEAALRTWSVQPSLVTGEAAKWQAFRSARSALAASGTVTLELALSGIPAVVGYKGSPIEAFVARRLVTVSSIVLPNLILGEVVVPELLQEECVGERLAAAWALLTQQGEARRIHLAALEQVAARMAAAGGSAGEISAGIVLAEAARKRAP